MRKMNASLVIAAVVLLILAISVPVQYLVRKEVVVGIASDSAHSHAHDESEHTHSDEESEEGEEEHQHEHTEEEGHLASEVPLGINLIPNYGFESGTREQIWGWYAVGMGQGETIYRDTAVARSGLASAALSTNGFEIRGAGWLMRLDELPLDHVVIVKGHIKTEGLSGAAYFKITLETRGQGSDEQRVLDWAYSDSVSGDGDWAERGVGIYVPPETTGVWLEAGMLGTGRAWFDDLSLVVEEAE